MSIFESSRRLAKNIKSAARLREIILVLAKYGFRDILKQANMSRKILNRLPFKYSLIQKDFSNLSVAERIRMSFEQLGPTFVKLGQLLSTRPDLIPQDWTEEFAKLQNQTQPVEYKDLEESLTEHFGRLEDVFISFDKTPIASASISQVYSAVLRRDHQEVVVKVRRPGIVETIGNDLNALYTLARLFEKYIPESQIYNPTGIVDEFFKTMELETNFIVEANNTLKFKKNFKDDPTVKIPHVFLDLSGKQVLVMERLKGIPLNRREALNQKKTSQQAAHSKESPLENIDPQMFLKRSVKIFVKMVFLDCFFHGDLHAGNIFVLPDQQVGLVDFGVVGRLNKHTRKSIANMCIALASENYDRLAYEFIALAAYNAKTNSEQFARQLRDLIAPYFGLSGHHVNSGHLLMKATNLAARNHLRVPAELVMFFKSIVTIDGMGRNISEDFDLMKEMTEVSEEVIKSQYDMNTQITEFKYFLQDTVKFLGEAPGQTRQWFRRVGSPNYRLPIEIDEMKNLRRSIENSSKLFFLGLIISGLIIASSLALSFNTSSSQSFLGLPLLSGIGFLTALFLSLLAFYNYIKK